MAAQATWPLILAAGEKAKVKPDCQTPAGE
jgi:hypothetical protein